MCISSIQPKPSPQRTSNQSRIPLSPLHSIPSPSQAQAQYKKPMRHYTTILRSVPHPLPRKREKKTQDDKIVRWLRKSTPIAYPRRWREFSRHSSAWEGTERGWKWMHYLYCVSERGTLQIVLPLLYYTLHIRIWLWYLWRRIVLYVYVWALWCFVSLE